MNPEMITLQIQIPAEGPVIEALRTLLEQSRAQPAMHAFEPRE